MTLKLTDLKPVTVPYHSRRFRHWTVEDFIEMVADENARAPGETLISVRVRYRDYLVEQGGRPMERAIIRAEQRYEKQKPARIRLSKIHSGYRRKR